MPVKVECESCKAPYTIDERRIPAAGLRVRCPKCTKTFVVKKPSGDGGDESAVTASAMKAQTAAGLPSPGGDSFAKLPAQAPGSAETSTPPAIASSDFEPDLPAPAATDVGLPATRAAAAAPRKPVIKGTALGLGGLVPGVVKSAGVQIKPREPDLPAPRAAATVPGGELDLPAARAPAAKASFDVDLPAVGRGGADLPAIGRGGADLPAIGRGGADLPAIGRGVDLPAVGRPAPPRPPMKTQQGFDDLPAPAADLPVPATRVDLPAVPAPKPKTKMEFGEIDLPAVGVGRDLPAVATGRDLPAVATGRDLPAVATGRDLPAVATGRDLPAPRGASTKKFGEADLPEVSGHLPATRSPHADLPAVGQGAHLPAVAATAANLPAVRHDDYGMREPSVAMPSPSDPFSPNRDFAVAQTMVGPGVQPSSGFGDSSGFGELELPGPGGSPSAGDPWGAPAPSDLGLRSGTARGFGEVDLGGDLGPSPRAATGVGASGVNAAPSIAPPGGSPTGASDFGELELPGPGAGMGASPSAETFGGDQPGVDDFGPGEIDHASKIDSRATGGAGFGEVDLGGGGGDDALEFGAIPEEKRAEGAAGSTSYEAPLPKPRAEKVEAPVEEEKKPSNIGKFAVGFLVLALLGGAGLSFTELGPFGIRAITDKVNAEKHAGMLTTGVKRTRDAFGEDSLPKANDAVVALQKDVGDAPRYAPLLAYMAYSQFAHELRYGKDPARDTLARSALGKLKGDAPHRQLAEAARDAVAGQLAPARAALKSVTAADAKNVDAWVTLGEVELRAKQPKDAVVAFESAVKAKDDARTRAGLMRANDAAGNIDKAKAEATAVATKFPSHAGSRLLLAKYAWERDKDEKEALKWLTELEKPGVLAGASVVEQVDANTLRGSIHLERGRVSSAKKAFEEAIAAAKNTPSPGPRLGLGEVHMANGEYPKAITEFNIASQADPTAALPKLGIARAFLKQEKATEAKAQLINLKDPTLAGEIGFWLGQAEEKLDPGKPGEAIKIYEAAIKAQPSEVKPYIALANLQSKIGKIEDSDATLAAAAKNVPPSERLHLGVGELRFRQERYDQALEHFTKALELQPSNLEAMFSKAKTLLRMGDRVKLDEGKAVLDQVAAKDDKYPGLPLEYGLYYQKTAQIDEALKQYKAALERAPEDVDIQLSVARAQVEARMKEAESRLLEIMGNCTKSPSPDVCLAEANHYYGRALLTRGDSATAKVYLEKAAAKNDNNAQYHLYLAWALVDNKMLTDADKEVTRTLELDKSLGVAHYLRGEIDASTGNYKEAIENAKKALTLSPSLSQAHALIAWSNKQLNQEEAALNAYAQAIKLDPTNPRAAFWRFTVADIHHHRNSVARATNELREAIKQAKAMTPPPGWLAKAHFYLGEALRHTDKTEAIKEYREYLSMSGSTTDPARKEAEAAVRELTGKP